MDRPSNYAPERTFYRSTRIETKPLRIRIDLLSSKTLTCRAKTDAQQNYNIHRGSIAFVRNLKVHSTDITTCSLTNLWDPLSCLSTLLPNTTCNLTHTHPHRVTSLSAQPRCLSFWLLSCFRFICAAAPVDRQTCQIYRPYEREKKDGEGKKREKSSHFTSLPNSDSIILFTNRISAYSQLDSQRDHPTN